MAAKKTTPAPDDESLPLHAAKEQRAHDSAQKLIGQAIEMLASSGPMMTADGMVSAAIPNPVSRGRSMIDAQKFRVNWYQIERCHLNRIARLVTERNWFANPVHHINKAIWGAGFHFPSKPAQDWIETGSYPFARIQSDLLEEYLVNNAVCAFWRKNPPPGTLPMIEVPDIETVKYETIGGIPQITVTVTTNRRISESLREIIGEKMWCCIKEGKRLVIAKQGDNSDEYDFEILKDGKSNACIPAPRITGILDDLDYIEAVRCGDWNGAWSRREIIRHTKKGSGVSSGPNAGTARNNAKSAEINSILAAMKSILGKADVATNWDQEIAWLVFPKDFFDPAMVDAALRRLVFWGGFASLLLLKTDSQIAGLEAYARDIMRARILGFRHEFCGFLKSIFHSPSFRNLTPEGIDLTPAWSVKSLYSSDGLNKLATLFATYGITSTTSLREMFDLDDEWEGDRMEATHENPKRVTPPYEPRQGIASAFTVPDAAPGTAPSAAIPGEPGRPAAGE
jgi:hypothetical protein